MNSMKANDAIERKAYPSRCDLCGGEVVEELVTLSYPDKQGRVRVIEGAPAGDTLDMTYQGPTQDERDTKTVTKDTGATTTTYGHDVMGVAWEETDALTTLYTRTPGGKLLGRRSAGTGADDQYYTLDHLGSVRDVTDASGAPVQKYTYQPYGRMFWEKDDTFDNPWQFAQGYLDPASGLQKHGVRFYDDVTGRFTQLDPNMGNVFDPTTLNLYQYGNCDPANRTDPTGRFSCLEEIFAVSGAFALVKVIAIIGELAVHGWTLTALGAALTSPAKLDFKHIPGNRDLGDYRHM